MKMIKTAKFYKVVYFPGYTAPSNSAQIRIDPDDLLKEPKESIDQIIEKRLQLRHPEEPIIIDKIIPVGDINWRTFNKREQARFRGEQRRKEIEKRKLQKEIDNMKKEKVEVKEILKEVEKQEEEVSLIDMLKSRKRTSTESSTSNWYKKSIK